MRIAAVILAALALAGPALAGPPPQRVHAAPARHTDQDTLPAWLLPTGAVAVLVAAALASRRL